MEKQALWGWGLAVLVAVLLLVTGAALAFGGGAGAGAVASPSVDVVAHKWTQVAPGGDCKFVSTDSEGENDLYNWSSVAAEDPSEQTGFFDLERPDSSLPTGFRMPRSPCSALSPGLGPTTRISTPR